MKSKAKTTLSIAQAKIYLDQKDYSKAAKAFDALVKERDAEAMYIRAGFAPSDQEISDFDSMRLRLLRSAAELGHPAACYELAMHLESGDLGPQDEAEAMDLIRRAAALQHPHAIWRLGIMHIYGTGGLPEDIALGRSLIEKAAAAKSQGALRTLAEFRAKGLFGYERDLDESRRLLQRAENDDVVPI
jgi:TPR repeat protein